MKVYSMTKHGTDFEVYTVKDSQYFEFTIDDGTDNNFGVVTLDIKQIRHLIEKLDHKLFIIGRTKSDNSSKCGCTINDGCDAWFDVAALQANHDDERLE